MLLNGHVIYASGWLVAAAVFTIGASPSLGGAFDRMVVFGDSLSDTGNVLFNTTGAVVSQRPVAPWYDAGRWTNGTATNNNAQVTRLGNSAFTGVWHEALARRWGMNPARATLQQNGGLNFAYGGATTANTAGTYTNNIGHQVRTQYLGNNPVFTSSTLYCIWGGGNDIRDEGNAIFFSEAATRTAATTAVTRIESYIGDLTAAAPQNVFVTVVWPNVPPMQLIPDFLNAAANRRTAVQLAAQDFRDRQLEAATRLRNAHPRLRLHTVNVHGYFTEVAAGRVFDLAGLDVSTPVLNFNGFSGIGFNPTRNAAVPDGASPDGYVFWDRVHPTSRMHDLIGELAFQAIPEPSAVAVLALIGVCAARRRRAA
ncbi:MAG: hypothetical protein IT438_00175 [Phycisphaerales bacterium]|nr:hypothetical protein [Phycisphaerales bacterium]